MTDTNASARYAAQRATVDNILGDHEADGLRAAMDTDRIRDLILREIGQAFVNSEDSDAAALRQALWNLETLTELGERVIEEHTRIEENAP